MWSGLHAAAELGGLCLAAVSECRGGLGCCEQIIYVGHPGQSREGTGADWR